MRAIAIVGLSLLLLGCGGLPNNNLTIQQVVGDQGQLYKLSGQSFTSSKKVLFIHGRYLSETDPNGHTQADVERLFASKLDQLDYVCKQQFGGSFMNSVEVWFYTYNTHQSMVDVATDLAELIQNNPSFRDSEICVIGYSEGGLVAWLLDQRYQLIKGGILLGAPILGSPLADQAKVEAAVNKKFGSGAQDAVHQVVSWLLNGSDDLVNSYPETGRAKSELMMFAGQIDLPVTGFTRHGVDVVCEALDSYIRDLGWQTSNRQAAELAAIIVDVINENELNQQARSSDGIIPITSATFGSNNFRIWEDYDHYDLLSGKDDLILDRATFDWIDHVLHLRPEFASGDSIPTLPEINLNVSARNLLDTVKFAYIKDGQLILADSNFAQQTSIAGDNRYPRFSPDGTSLIWTSNINSGYGIYLLDSNGISSLTNGRYGSLSPDGDQLIFQRSDELLIRDMSTGAEDVIVSGVNITSPPVWWKSLLSNRIYFVHQNSSGTNSLYWVDSDTRDISISSANLMADDCDVIFPFNGYISGVAAADITGGTSKLWLVTGLFGDLSLEVQSNVDQPGFDTHGVERTLKLDQSCQFDTAVTDWETGLYLTGNLDGEIGIYYLDIARLTTTVMDLVAELSQNSSPAQQLSVDDVLKLVVPGGTQLDIKPAPD
ncbi:hypothetical protein KJ836_03395 [Patescibacteria group bacterium]|nr:hypothetical protein [Patescibacteria group bacterium]